ncbi:MAG: SH3 domain-containing protein [Alphaproteobacteria bacterium]|nr:SH3 domain-containing protein [Alphaproteobacteria bacterium]
MTANGAGAGQDDTPFRVTAYPLPRFVSLSSDEVFVRTGPGQRYPVRWAFKKDGLPVEIILEYDIWRKIRDHDGEEGWVHKSLLSGRRTALITGESPASLYRKPDENSRLSARLEPGVLVSVKSCGGVWCNINTMGYEGWAKQNVLWGVYENEIFD